MKTFLTTVLLCATCVGAFAQDPRAGYSLINNHADLQNGMEIYLKNEQDGNKYLGGLTADKNTTTWAPSNNIVLTSAGENQYKLQFKSANNASYIKFEAGSTTASLTSTANDATVFTASTKNTSYIRFTYSDNSQTYQLVMADGKLISWSGDDQAPKRNWKVYYKDKGNGNIEALQAKIDKLFQSESPILHKGIGYPKYYGVVIGLSNYRSGMGGEVTSANYDVALDAYNKVMTSNDINLPVDGKAYIFKAVLGNGTEDVLYYDQESGRIKGAEKPTEGHIFYCKNTGTEDAPKFMFVNEYGKFLTWGSSASISTNSSAVLDEYSQYADITIAKATQRTDGNGQDVDDEGRFGLVTIQALRQGTETLWYSNYKHGSDQSTFVESGAANKWYDGNEANRTHMYRIVEAEANQNTITLTNPNKGKEKKSQLDHLLIGTFSCVYDVELPEDVEAYTATDEGTYVRLTLLGDGHVVPKNTGVLLYSTRDEESVTFDAVPSTESAEIGENIFVGTMSGTATMEREFYLLGNMSQGVGFYPAEPGTTLGRNKAYLKFRDAQVISFVFDFDGENTTGISITPTSQSNDTSTFDLSGRKVNDKVKGIFIKNGTKVIR